LNGATTSVCISKLKEKEKGKKKVQGKPCVYLWPSPVQVGVCEEEIERRVVLDDVK
jgi:hypothetical protein